MLLELGPPGSLRKHSAMGAQLRAMSLMKQNSPAVTKRIPNHSQADTAPREGLPSSTVPDVRRVQLSDVGGKGSRSLDRFKIYHQLNPRDLAFDEGYDL